MCSNVKKFNKRSLLVSRIISTAVECLDSWSRVQIIDSVQCIFGFYDS